MTGNKIVNAKAEGNGETFNYLDWMTPLGKRLGDCTKEDVLKIAAFFKGLAAAGGEVNFLEDGSTPTCEPEFIDEHEEHDPDAVERNRAERLKREQEARS
ncbi:MAG: hypothetical protein U1E81_12405 [Xanthobacteraceae bacterium]